jgi:hypothetical protein
VWATDAALWGPSATPPFPTAAHPNDIDSWIDNAIAARSTFVFTGPDERIVIKGSDNGDSETTDHMHYSALGQSLWAQAWQLTLGY